MKKNQWKEWMKIKLRDPLLELPECERFGPPASLFTLVCTKEEWQKRVQKRCARLKAKFYRVALDSYGGQWLVVTNRLIKDAIPITWAESL